MMSSNGVHGHYEYAEALPAHSICNPEQMIHINRIGEKKIQHIQDILNVFRLLPGRPTLPYVAKELAKLPPL